MLKNVRIYYVGSVGNVGKCQKTTENVRKCWKRQKMLKKISKNAEVWPSSSVYIFSILPFSTHICPVFEYRPSPAPPLLKNMNFSTQVLKWFRNIFYKTPPFFWKILGKIRHFWKNQEFSMYIEKFRKKSRSWNFLKVEVDVFLGKCLEKS